MSTNPASTEREFTDEEASRFCENVWQSIERKKRAEALSDVRLVEEVIDKVWGKFSFSDERMDLLDELIDRFEKRAGIKRDEETGEIIT